MQSVEHCYLTGFFKDLLQSTVGNGELKWTLLRMLFRSVGYYLPVELYQFNSKLHQLVFGSSGAFERWYTYQRHYVIRISRLKFFEILRIDPRLRF